MKKAGGPGAFAGMRPEGGTARSTAVAPDMTGRRRKRSKGESSGPDRESKSGSDSGEPDCGALGSFAAGEFFGLRSGPTGEHASLFGVQGPWFPWALRAFLAVSRWRQRLGSAV